MIKTKKPHPSHRMSKWEVDVRAPAGTPRFYSVRQCVRCGEEEMKHAAGHFVDRLQQPCAVPPRARKKR